MKTKDKILAVSLQLFNEEGEDNITPVDIANEMGISPGNLYYHFKGKDPIIHALYDDFEEEMRMVLNAPIERPMNMADNWVYLYILHEEVADFRFFFQNLQSLLQRYPVIKGKFQSLTKKINKTMQLIVTASRDNNYIEIPDIDINQVADRFTMQLIFWPTYQSIMLPQMPTPKAIHTSVYTIFSAIAPYIIDGPDEFRNLLQEFYNRKS